MFLKRILCILKSMLLSDVFTEPRNIKSVNALKGPTMLAYGFSISDNIDPRIPPLLEFTFISVFENGTDYLFIAFNVLSILARMSYVTNFLLFQSLDNSSPLHLLVEEYLCCFGTPV